MPETTSVFLRDTLKTSIGDFLYAEKFRTNEKIRLGILEIINLISDYKEEGNSLFPEILLTSSSEIFKTIPNKRIVIAETPMSVNEFKNAVKMCAPLASNGWIIFIEINGSKLTYGIASAEISETSPSMYSQAVGQLSAGVHKKFAVALIRNIGPKTVELVGKQRRLEVSLTLDERNDRSFKEVQTLCQHIVSQCDEQYRGNILTFFERVIDDALKTGHGNLIAVVDDSDEAVQQLRQTIDGKGGVYLPVPIDFPSLIIEAETERNNETSVNLKAHASVLRSMLNHDGITVITNQGKVLGYHIIIGDFLRDGEVIEGGSRSKAYRSMQNCGVFTACFFKSQDGNVKVWVKE